MCDKQSILLLSSYLQPGYKRVREREFQRKRRKRKRGKRKRGKRKRGKNLREKNDEKDILYLINCFVPPSHKREE